MKQINLLDDTRDNWNKEIKLGHAYHVSMNKLFDGDAILIDIIPDIITFFGSFGFFTLNIANIQSGLLPDTIFEME